MQKVCFIFFFVFFTAQVSQAEVLAFKIWKAQRIEAARNQLEKTQQEQRNIPLTMKDAKAAKIKMSQQLSQAQLNVEIEQELTINDYFVLYLSQLKGYESSLEAAKKLSPEEVAELLQAYQKHLNGLDQVIEPSSPSVTATLKSPQAGP